MTKKRAQAKTPWFPKDVLPVRVGFYERDWTGDGNSVDYEPDYCDGKNWRIRKGGYPWLGSSKELPWRGLKVAP